MYNISKASDANGLSCIRTMIVCWCKESTASVLVESKGNIKDSSLSFHVLLLHPRGEQCGVLHVAISLKTNLRHLLLTLHYLLCFF